MHVVPKVDGVVNDKRSEVFLCMLWPMKYKMEKRGSCPIEDGLDMAFRVILMMGANPRKILKLMLIIAVSDPLLGKEEIVVRGIVLRFDVVVTQKCFKRVFAA